MKYILTATALTVFLLGICSIGAVGAGTFAIDYFLLTFLSYWITRRLYRPGGFIATAQPKVFWRFFFTVCAPVLSIVPLWVGGALAYWNWIPAAQVYFGLVPQWILGTPDGNDFMWRLIIPGLGSWRVVPEHLLPTYHHVLFTLLGVLIWLGMPVVFFWAVLRGKAHSFLYAQWTHRQRFSELFRIGVIAGMLQLFVIGLTRFLVSISS